MKALAGLFVVACAIFFMFAVVGQPTYSGSDGTTVSYSGLTIFDSWNLEAQQKTERIRIQEAQETERKRVMEEAMTQRNKDFWGQAPWVLLSIAGICGAIGGTFVGVAWATNRPASKPGTAIQPVTRNYYDYRQDATYYTYQQYNADTPTPQQLTHDYSQGLPPIPDGRRITVSRR